MNDEYARLWEIIKELAESDPYAYNDNNGKMECLFCNDSWGWGANDKQKPSHAPDCLISEARVLVKEHSCLQG